MTRAQRIFALSILAFVVLALMGGLGVAVLPSPVSYTLTPTELRVDAMLGPFNLGDSVPRADLGAATPIHIETASRARGTATSVLCQGSWKINEEWVWLATTCGREALRIDVGEAPWVIAPADPEGFLAALNGGEGTFPAAKPGPNHLRTGAMIPFAVVLAFTVWLVARLSRPMEYRIEGAHLVVPAHFKDVRIPLLGATFKTEDLDWVWRSAGSGMPGLLLGSFRVGSRKIHIAARARRGGISVEKGKQAVYVTPADAQAFCAALVENGARPGAPA